MKKIAHYALLLLIIAGWVRCTEPYEHEVDDFENVLVIQGMITNQPGPYRVKISRTMGLSEKHPEAYRETGAVVTISDEKGNFETLTEKAPGIYQTDPNGIQGNIGHEYVLTVYTADGSNYESEPVTLTKGPDIDAINPRAVEYYSVERNKKIKGVDINVSTESWEKGQELYFRWDFEETWEMDPLWSQISLDKLYEIYEKGDYRQSIPTPGNRKSYNEPEDTANCWNTLYSDNIVIHASSELNTQKIEQHTLLHLDEYNAKPVFGYSLNVRQYIVNKAVYDFWKMLKNNTQDNGSIFDNIPYNVQGNIYSCENTSQEVFGYFDACYVSEKRVHYKSPIEGVEFFNKMENCITDTINWNDFLFDSEFRQFPREAVHVVSYNAYGPFYTNQTWCVTCREYASDVNKPDFWIY